MNPSDNTKCLSPNRRRYLRSLMTGGIFLPLTIGASSATQEVNGDILNWTNQDNLSDIAQWHFSPSTGYEREDSFFTNPYPDSGTVYVGDIGGRLHAINSNNGERIWSYEEAELPIWSQPNVHQNKVYFATGETEDNGSVYALNRDTGEEEWVLGSFNNPIQDAIAASNGIIYFVSGQETFAVDSETGEQLWRIEPGGVPILRGDTAYIYSGSPTALDAESGEVIWEANPDISFGPHRPLLIDNKLFAGDGCYDIESGEELFTINTNINDESEISDEFLFVREDGAVQVYDANSGNNVREISVSGNIRSISYSEKTLYVGTAQTEDGGGEEEEGGILYAIDTETGEYLWAASKHNAELRLSPYTDNGLVFVAGTTGDLYAVEHGVNPFSDATGPPVYQSSSDNQNSILMSALVGAGAIGAYIGYRMFGSKKDKQSELKDEALEYNKNNTDPSVDNENLQTQLNGLKYEDFSINGTVRETPNYQLQQGEAEHQTVWILRPPLTDSETISSTASKTFNENVNSWSRMDSHPNLTSILEIGTEPIPWAAIQVQEGTTFLDQANTLSFAETVDILTQICEALHHVHRYGMRYGNLTTESVLYTDAGTVNLQGVLDTFGEPNPWYNAPEEFDGESTERSTVYRVGVIAYELLTGTLPYTEYPNGNPEKVIKSSELIPPSEQVDSIPAELESIVMKVLSKSPDNRHETVLHLRDDLDSINNS